MTDGEFTYALRVEGSLLDVDGLAILVKESGLPLRRQRALLVTLRAAQRAFAHSRCGRAFRRLSVFQKKVRARISDVRLAGQFLEAAQIIIDRECAAAMK